MATKTSRYTSFALYIDTHRPGLSFRTYSGNPCKIFFRKIEFSAKIFEFMTKFPWVCGNFLNFRKNSLLWRHCCFIGVPTFFRNIEFLKNMLEFFEKIAWVLVFLEYLIAWVFFENANRQAPGLLFVYFFGMEETWKPFNNLWSNRKCFHHHCTGQRIIYIHLMSIEGGTR